MPSQLNNSYVTSYITSALIGLMCKFSCIKQSLLFKGQGPVVQSIVSLTSSLVVKILTALVSTISNSQVFLLLTFFSAKISAYMPYLMIKVLTIR